MPKPALKNVVEFPDKNGVKQGKSRENEAITVRSIVRPRKLPPYVVDESGKWYVRLVFPTVRRDARGQIVYTQVKRRLHDQTAEGALALARAIEEEYNKVKPTPSMILNEFIPQYLEVRKGILSRKVYEQTQQFFDRLVGSLGQIPLNEITTRHIEVHYASLGSTPSVIRSFNKKLSGLFKKALSWGLIEKNPLEGIELPPEDDPDVQIFDEQQAQEFIRICQESDRFILLELLLESGARPGEIIPLTWSDIDWKRETISITKAIVFGLKGGGWLIKGPKTKAGKRVVELSPEIMDRLRVQRQLVDAQIKKAKRKIKEPLLLQGKGTNYQNRKHARKVARETLNNLLELDLVFPSTVGTYRPANNLNHRLLREITDKMGLKGYSLYSLRHSHITLLAAKGIPLKAIASRCGQKDVSVTLNRYVHLLPSSRQQAVGAISGVLYKEAV